MQVKRWIFFFLQEGDSVELQIVRSRGSLVRQFLRYTVEPRDNNEFYGSTGILEFQPGEREIIITLLTRMDGIPEVEMKIFLSSTCAHSIRVCHLLEYIGAEKVCSAFLQKVFPVSKPGMPG